MTIVQRTYNDTEDLYKISHLIRKTYAHSPTWNSWSFALFDIWSQRKLGDEQVHGETGWHQDIRLWEGIGKNAIGAAVFRDPDLVKLMIEPAYSLLYRDMLDWVEIRSDEVGPTDKALTIETTGSNTMLEGLLADRGYTKKPGYYSFREKSLDPNVTESVHMPTGFTIKHIETTDELLGFFQAVEAVFKFMDNVDIYQVLRQAQSFRSELDLIIKSPDDEVAAISSTWFDEKLSLAEFEPLGTVPDFRKMGLGTALIAETCNRLRKLGCCTLSVHSWSESEGANAIYSSAGLLPTFKKNYWRKEVS